MTIVYRKMVKENKPRYDNKNAGAGQGICHSRHLGAGGSDAAMLSAACLCALPNMSASVRQVSC